jgi:hypothetical protein
MLLRFVRGRGDFRVDIAPEHAPNDWQEVGEAIASIKGSETPRYYRFEDLGQLLKENFGTLAQALSRDEYGPPQPNRQTIKLTRLS